MRFVRSGSAIAVCVMLTIGIMGCASEGPASQNGGANNPPSTTQQDDKNSTGRQPADNSNVTTTGLDWPEGWPSQFPRVSGEIIGAVSNSDDNIYSVTMYVEPGVPAGLIETFKAQGLTVLSDDSSGTADMAAFSDGEWRIDIIGVLQQQTERPHLRYLLQKQ